MNRCYSYTYTNSLVIEIKQLENESVRQRKRPNEGEQSYNNNSQIILGDQQSQSEVHTIN
jgi:hypothetical protein